MTPQERDLLTGFLDNLRTAGVPNPDAEADRLIREAFAQQPQAAYLLVQQALIQQIALRDAQAKAARLEQQARDQQGLGQETSFLAAGGPMGPARAPGQGWDANPTAVPQARAGGVGNFLRSAAAAAVGVAGGAMLFQGLESLFARHGNDPANDPESGFLGSGTPLVAGDPTLADALGDPAAADPRYADPFLGAGPGADADFGDDGFALGDDGTADWV